MLDGIKNLDVKPSKAGVEKIDPVTIPGFVPASAGMDAQDYRIRYMKIDVDDPGQITELEAIETAALRNQGVYILGRERFFFMDKIFILVNYIEKAN